jgi:hypothetical protein
MTTSQQKYAVPKEVKIFLSAVISFLFTYFSTGFGLSLYTAFFVPPLDKYGFANPQPGLWLVLIGFLAIAGYHFPAAMGLWLISFTLYGYFVFAERRRSKLIWLSLFLLALVLIAISGFTTLPGAGLAWLAALQVIETLIYLAIRRGFFALKNSVA